MYKYKKKNAEIYKNYKCPSCRQDKSAEIDKTKSYFFPVEGTVLITVILDRNNSGRPSYFQQVIFHTIKKRAFIKSEILTWVRNGCISLKNTM